MDARAERIGRNEAIFRAVNERVKQVNEAFSLVLEQSDFVCECGSADCVQHIRMTLEEYERVRADPTLFAIVPGHDSPLAERVVEQVENRFAVVQKDPGDPAELAKALDPRS